MTTEQWARAGIVGDPNSEDPTDDELAPWITAVKMDLPNDYPCIGQTPWTTLTGNDLEFWNRWSGCEAAARFALSPIGRQYIGAMAQKIKLGPVEITTGSSSVKTPDSIAESMREEAARARSGITCIKNGNKKATYGYQPMSGLAGIERARDARRRSRW